MRRNNSQASMPKTTEKLLELVFAESKVDVDTLKEVILSSSNPEIAVEMLTGLYEEPKILAQELENNGEEGRSLRHNLKLVNFDKFSDRVVYSYDYAESNCITVLKEDTRDFTYQDIKDLTQAGDDTCTDYFTERLARKLGWKEGADKEYHSFLREECKIIRRYGAIKAGSEYNDMSLSSWNKLAEKQEVKLPA
jgi:hypothetical protein